MLQKEEFHPPAHVIWRLADTVGGLKPNKVQQIKIANSIESFSRPAQKFPLIIYLLPTIYTYLYLIRLQTLDI